MNFATYSQMQREPKWIRTAICLVAGLLAFAQGESHAQTTKEYQLKAAFLYNFAQFVEWPTNAFTNQQTPVVIGILGDDPFGKVLDEIVRDEKVNGRSLIIQRYRQVDEIKTCHVLFINQTEANRLEKILKELKGRSILTVSDFEGFAKRGGMINFLTEKNKIRFRINVEAAKAAELTVSSKLLRVADVAAVGQD